MDRDLSNFRPSKLWRRMPLERRIDAAGLFWDDEHSAEQQVEAVSAIASHMKFRPRSVISLAPDKRAKYLAAKFPADDVSLYLSTLVSQDPETWDALIEIAQPESAGSQRADLRGG